MTFQIIQETFEKLYMELREQNNEYAPSSYTWFAPTLKALRAEVGFLWSESEWAKTIPRVGGGKIIAYIYECNSPSLTAIGVKATDDEVAELLALCMGMSETD